jgi:signal transduction histidine kinase
MSAESITILLIEDNVTFGRAVSALIQSCIPEPTNIVVMRSLTTGLHYLQKQPVTMVLLDLTLPDSEGLAGLKRIRDCSNAVPIVILTGIDDEKLALEALKLGAQDYLLKGDIGVRQLKRTISYAIERKRLQLLEAERLRLYEQREDFMATITHDLKNPLIGSNRILELLGDGHIGSVSEDARELLFLMRDSNNTLISMIRNLAEVYRYERDVNSLVLEHTDLSLLIPKYLGSMQSIIGSRLKLTSEIPSNFRPIFVDQNAIVRVVQNLLDNAIKFSPEGGAVTIKLWEESNKALFAISDQGPGISREEKTKLFKRFSQGRSGRTHTTGTGLGLYLCRQIVEAHNGQIWCQSEEKQGSTFTVSLPLAS